MKTSSNANLPKFQKFGNRIHINFNETEVIVEDDSGPYTEWRYDTAIVDVGIGRNQIIESIIKSCYPTYGAELAAIHNGGIETQDYLSLREESKTLADELMTWLYA